MIKEKLRYDSVEGKWIAGYPYLHPQESLNDSRNTAMKYLLSKE